MFEKLDIFRMAHGLATHSAARQATLAQNIANADTPSYHARDLKPFAQSYAAATDGSMRATRTTHIGASGDARLITQVDVVSRPGAASPNGNNVSLEQEMMSAALVKGQHDRALAVYKSALNVLRTSVNGGR